VFRRRVERDQQPYTDPALTPLVETVPLPRRDAVPLTGAVA
jgi:hypothetical protein